MQSLRGVSLPNREVLELLQSSFVVGWTNIQKELHVGMSHGYRCDQTAVGTTNGAGGRNLQMYVLAADGTVLHALPGFWHPEDLVDELRFALDLQQLWQGDAPREQKDRMFQAMHRARLRGLSPDTLARSAWQDFDEREELMRHRREPRDTVALDRDGVPQLKPVCVLVHERMMARPFRPLAAFDTEKFVDYGRPWYDNNLGIDAGREFRAAIAANNKRSKQKAKAEAALSKGRGQGR